MAWFISPRELKRRGILAMNRRNIDFIFRYNERSRYPLVDDKLQTKKLAEAAGLNTPPLLGVVSHYYENKKLLNILGDHTEFVIKPAKGSAGNGILVIKDRRGDEFIRANGKSLRIADLQRHTANILSGLHSLGGQLDCAIIEGLIHFDEKFANLAAHGVPDLRIMVFRGYPVMAMLRIPTAASDGKANLHQGAFGLGIDIATGRGVCGVQFNRLLRHHPDLNIPFEDIALDDWEELLRLASRAYDVTGLGYLGADLVIDARHGPQVLELNARPGLAIQLANNLGLIPRLEKIAALPSIPSNPSTRIAQAREWFARQALSRETTAR